MQSLKVTSQGERIAFYRLMQVKTTGSAATESSGRFSMKDRPELEAVGGLVLVSALRWNTAG
jgi:hypothetical protein